MIPLSPHYRNDPEGALDTNIKWYLDEHYLPQLHNLDKTNPKVLVVFSGGNAMGKSTLARAIETRFNAIVLENDEVKKYVKQVKPDIQKDELNPIVWFYNKELYERLQSMTRNGLIVRDGVIDWYYDRILPFFEKNGYRLFVIAFDLSEQKQRELIAKRGDTPTLTMERAYELLEDHVIHQKRFREHYTPDVTITDDTLFDNEGVLKVLEDTLRSVT